MGLRAREGSLAWFVTPDIEAHSGAMFNQKGFAILSSPKLADGAHVSRFLAASEALVARAKG